MKSRGTHVAVKLGVVEEAADGDGPVVGQPEQVVLVDEGAAVVGRDEHGRRRVRALRRGARQADAPVRALAGPVHRQHKVRVVQRKLRRTTKKNKINVH